MLRLQEQTDAMFLITILAKCHLQNSETVCIKQDNGDSLNSYFRRHDATVVN